MLQLLPLLANAGAEVRNSGADLFPDSAPELRHASEEILHGLPLLRNPTGEVSPHLLPRLGLREEPRKASDGGGNGGNAKTDRMGGDKPGEARPAARKRAGEHGTQTARLAYDVCKSGSYLAQKARVAHELFSAAPKLASGLECASHALCGFHRLANGGSHAAERDGS